MTEIEKELERLVASGKATTKVNSGRFQTTHIDPLKIAKHFYEQAEQDLLEQAKIMDEADKRKETLQNERELNPDAFTKEVSADNQALLDAAKEYRERTPFQYPNQLQPAYEAFIAGAQWHKQYWDKVMRDNHVEMM